MQDQKVPQKSDVLAATVTFVGINLAWVFLVIWMLYGLVPVLVLATLINHIISRLDQRLN